MHLNIIRLSQTFFSGTENCNSQLVTGSLNDVTETTTISMGKLEQTIFDLDAKKSDTKSVSSLVSHKQIVKRQWSNL